MSQKLTKDEKKIFKKQKKSQETLLRHENIVCSDIPTKCLLVANGGLLNGISREDIYSLFSCHGNLMNIYMKQNKPYCFVEYSETFEAENAIIHIHGKELEYFQEISRPDLIFYLSFVNEVPAQIMNSKFAQPPGLTILNNFITEEEELQLMECLIWDAPELTSDDQLLKHRKVKHFGFKFDYKANKIDKEHPLEESIPPCCEVILERLTKSCPLNFVPDQLTVNQYQPGQGIPPHVDSHSSFEDDIIVISLGSQTVMDFKNPEGDHHPALLPERSVAIMSGDCRYSWSHGMTPRVSDVVGDERGLTLTRRGVRTSFTFRKVRRSPCCCDYPTLCDSQRESKCSEENMKMTDSVARQLESEHVYKVYNEIADHFSNTRHTPWPKVANFLGSLTSGSLVLDVGCGNGKYLGTRKGDICMIGCDVSQKLCEINTSQRNEVQLCNILQLPYVDGSFDAAICIAVIHHLASKERREASLREICRVVKPGGRILIYVWAMEQQRNGIKSNYLKKSEMEEDEKLGVNGESVKLPVHRNGTEFKSQDTLVPWHLRNCKAKVADDDSKVCHRFYHVFTEGELEGLCRSAGEIKVHESFYDQGNWCIDFSLAE